MPDTATKLAKARFATKTAISLTLALRLVANEIDRYSIGDRTRGLVYGNDGSLTVTVSTKKPQGKKAANWLPAPKGPFYMVIRAYNAEPEIFNGSWNPPELKLVK